MARGASAGRPASAALLLGRRELGRRRGRVGSSPRRRHAGAMPLFIAGFMFTAGPRWLRRPPISARPLRPPMGLFIAGLGVAVTGIHLAPTLAAAGLALSSPRLASGRTELIQPLLRMALWGGVTLVFIAASHRLLSFLGAGIWPALDARWPDWRPWRRCACGSRCAGCVCRPCGSHWSRCCSAPSFCGTLHCGSALRHG